MLSPIRTFSTPSHTRRHAPTRAPLALMQQESQAPTRPRSNAALAAQAGLDVDAARDADTLSVAAPTAASPDTVPDGSSAAPSQAAPAPTSIDGLAGPTAKLQTGDLRGAATELRDVANTQRKLLSGGGDRALLQASLAALAVTDTLVAAQDAKEAGNLNETTRLAQTALGTLRRAPMLTGTLRESSDFVGAQMTRHYGGAGARVFLPKARMGR